MADTDRRKRLWSTRPHSCALCGCGLTWETATVDHVIPQSKGGGNLPCNLVLACFPCNNAKGDSDPPPWLIDLAMIQGWQQRGIENGSLPKPHRHKKVEKKRLYRKQRQRCGRGCAPFVEGQGWLTTRE